MENFRLLKDLQRDPVRQSAILGAALGAWITSILQTIAWIDPYGIVPYKIGYAIGMIWDIIARPGLAICDKFVRPGEFGDEPSHISPDKFLVMLITNAIISALIFSMIGFIFSIVVSKRKSP